MQEFRVLIYRTLFLIAVLFSDFFLSRFNFYTIFLCFLGYCG